MSDITTSSSTTLVDEDHQNAHAQTRLARCLSEYIDANFAKVTEVDTETRDLLIELLELLEEMYGKKMPDIERRLQATDVGNRNVSRDFCFFAEDVADSQDRSKGV
jgi:hypothetical protein